LLQKISTGARTIRPDGVCRPDIAQEFDDDIHEKTVRRIVEDRLPDLRGHPWPVYAPLMLGISQMKLQGRLRTVLVDVGNLVILDVLPSILGRASRNGSISCRSASASR